MSDRTPTPVSELGLPRPTFIHMPTVQVKLLHEDAKLPTRSSPGASGWDVSAYLQPGKALMNGTVIMPDRSLVILPGDWDVIPLGFSLALPPGWEMQLRPRSGLAAKNGAVGYLGTIDSDYRGECCMMLFVASMSSGVEVKHGDRIGQAVFQQVPQIELVQVDKLSDTDRSTGGFGSTGR